MASRVQIVERGGRLVEGEDSVDQRGEGDFLVYQELNQADVILFGAYGDTPVMNQPSVS